MKDQQARYDRMSEQAMATLKDTLSDRFEQTNNLREQLPRERGLYVQANVYDERHRDLERRLTEHDKDKVANAARVDQVKTDRARATTMMGIWINVINVMLIIVGLVIHHFIS